MSACLGECMCLFVIVSDFVSAFCYDCVATVDLTEGYTHGCWSVCEPYYDWVMLPELSAYQAHWSIRAWSTAVQPHVSSTRALSLHQHSQCVSLWVIGLGARALNVSQSPSFTLTLMTVTHWPLQLLLGSLPLPSLLHRLLACTHSPMSKIHPSKTSTGLPETYTESVIIILILFDLLYIFCAFYDTIIRVNVVCRRHTTPQKGLRTLTVAIATTNMRLLSEKLSFGCER